MLWLNFAQSRDGVGWLLALELVDEKTPTTVLAALTLCGSDDRSCAFKRLRLELASSESAIEHYRVIGDLFGIARAQSFAGHALVALRREAEAKTLLREGVTVARELGNYRLLGHILRSLSYANVVGGDVGAARGNLAEALQVYEQHDSEYGAAQTMDDLAECEFRAGNAELALRQSTGSLAILPKTKRRAYHRRSAL